MTVETVGEALAAHWGAQARCQGRRRSKPKDSRDCLWSADIDMPTLVFAKGPNFPLALLPLRTMCPRCGGRDVIVLYTLPGNEARQGRP